MPSLKDTLQFIMEGGAVQRYHTRPGIRPDTDGKHSWGVALLAYILCVDRGMDTTSGTLMLAALTHDLGEQVYCDVSAPAKVALGLNKNLEEGEAKVRHVFGLNFANRLTDEEKAVLKIADSMECMMYCCQEAALGNRNVVMVFERSCTYLEDMITTDFEWEMYQALVQIWKESNGEIEQDRYSIETSSFRHQHIAGPSFDCFATEATPNHKPGKQPASRR